MKTLKSISTKIFVFVIALIFAAGCATVTDANIDLPENDNPTIETTTVNDDSFWNSRNGDDMDPIIDRPRIGGTMEPGGVN